MTDIAIRRHGFSPCMSLVAKARLCLLLQAAGDRLQTALRRQLGETVAELHCQVDGSTFEQAS